MCGKQVYARKVENRSKHQGVAQVYSMHRRVYPQTIFYLSHNYLIIIFYLSYNGSQRAILGMVRGAAPKEPTFRGRSYALHLGGPMMRGPCASRVHGTRDLSTLASVAQIPPGFPLLRASGLRAKGIPCSLSRPFRGWACFKPPKHVLWVKC